MAPGVAQAPAADGGPLVPGQPFGSRYHIIRTLGLGGMGAVYQAWDAELGVAVAMKVILPEVMADSTIAAEVEQRFKRELLLARKVTHKNVVRIHDLGEIRGIKYITMTYVDGQDLSTMLKREGTLLVPTVLRIARAVVSGLIEAHKNDVVHRDLKPANIMIAKNGDALIMDFGIAKGVDASIGTVPGTLRAPAGIRQTAVTADVTRYGSVLGTVEYMAPEQARGEEVDQRADIYALGLMLYDMLVGRRRRAEGTQSALDELKTRMAHAPPPIRSFDPDVPEAVALLVSRCVEPDAANRYQTTEDLAADLDRLDENGMAIVEPARVNKRVLAAAGVLLLALVAGTYFVGRRAAAPVVQHDPVSVLVADFKNGTNDPSFDGALEPALSRAIEGASFVSAYPRSDAQRLARRIRPGSALTEQLARLLAMREGIKMVVAAGIQQSPKGYQLVAQLIDPVGDGKVLATFTELAAAKSDVLPAVDALSRKIRAQLGDTNLTHEENATSETFTAASLDAAREYSLGNDLGVQQKYDEAIPHYRRATELDPNLGRAFSGWAIAAGQLGQTDQSVELWKKALALVDRMNDREKYRTLGTYYSRVARNQQLAIENFEKVVKQYPADGASYNNLALAYFRMLRYDDAYKAGARLLQIYPRTLLYRNNYVLYAMYASDFQTAATEARKIIEEAPTSYVAYMPAAIAAIDGGNVVEATRIYEEMKKTGAAGASAADMGLADLALHAGRYAEAETILKAALPQDRTTKNVAGEAAKLNALAEMYLAQNRVPLAVSTAQEALKLGKSASVVVPAARTLIAAGRDDEGTRIAADLGASLEAQSRAYGKLLEGEIALKQRRTVDGIETLLAAVKLADLWMIRYTLGVAYAGADHSPEAIAALEACYKRRGEAAADPTTDIPSYRNLTALPYWLGRAQQGVGSQSAAAENFKKFLNLRPEGLNDPLAADARKRLGS